MKLLVFTQKVDKNDPILGFFHTWIEKMAEKAESISVICLSKGEYSLPNNVTVYSLGKENKFGRIKYIINFYKYLHLINGSYDKVFVHMNQEYVILGGIYWKLNGVPVYMWRNHKAGNALTNFAVMLSTKVFCTSEYSYTAKYKKTVIMPAGIDTNMFKPVEGVVRKKYSVGMIGRISPVKRLDLALSAIKILVDSGRQVSLSLVGPVAEKDKAYSESLEEYVSKNGLSQIVHFGQGVSMDKLPEIYSSIEVCLNLTDAGSFDKTIVESASCGAIPLVSNKSFEGKLPQSCITEDDAKSVAASIDKLLYAHEQIQIQDSLSLFVKNQSLDNLMNKLFSEIS